VSKSNTNLFLGVGLLFVGLVWLLNNVGAMDFDLGDLISRAWPVAIIVLGAWMLFGGSSKADSKIQKTLTDSFSQGVGDLELAPEHLDPNGLEVKLGAGEIKLDLRATRLQQGKNVVQVKLGVGDIVVDAPSGVPLSVDGRTGAGDLRLLDRKTDGFAARLDIQDEQFAAADICLHIIARSGLGDITVTRP
jgi:predicted membrane protein